MSWVFVGPTHHTPASHRARADGMSQSHPTTLHAGPADEVVYPEGTQVCVLFQNECPGVHLTATEPFGGEVPGCATVFDMKQDRFSWGVATTPYSATRGCTAKFFSPIEEELFISSEGKKGYLELKDGFSIPDIIVTPSSNSPVDAVGSVCAARVCKGGTIELERFEQGKSGEETPFNVLVLGNTDKGGVRLLTNVTGRKERSWIVDVPSDAIIVPGARSEPLGDRKPPGTADRLAGRERGTRKKKRKCTHVTDGGGGSAQTKKSKLRVQLEQSLALLRDISTQVARGEGTADLT